MINRIKDKFKRLCQDRHLREVAYGAVIAIALKVIGAVLTFGFNVAIARLLGVEGAGLYFLAFSITAIGAVIASFGLDSALLRFTAIHATKNEWGMVKGVYGLGMQIAIIASVLVTIVIFLSAPWLTTVLFEKPELTEPVIWMSFSILPFVILTLQSEALKGLKYIRNAMVIQGIGLPLVSLLLIVPLSQSSGLLGVTVAYICGAGSTAMLGLWFWYKAIAKCSGAIEKYSFSDLWVSCKPLWVVSIMNRGLLPWAPVLLLGIWSTSEDVGVFGAAMRVSVLVSFLLLAVNNVIVPKLAELHTKGDIVALANISRRSAFFITLLVFPIFCFLFFYGSWVMELFGDEFTKGGIILSILVLGQLVNVVCGSAGYLLIMSGNEKVLRNITLVFALLQFTLIVSLAPIFGGVGAAIAVGVCMALTNIVAAYFVYLKLGFIIIPSLKSGVKDGER